jgi:hypothetical protein
MSIRREDLLGEWIHSHEEDEADRKVFRRSDYPFPPARGRDAVEFKADDTAVVRGPGPTDVPEEETGKWALGGETIRVNAGGEARTMDVISCDDERLEVREYG